MSAAAQPIVYFAGKIGSMFNVKYAFLRAAADDYGFHPCFLTESKEELAALRAAGLPVATKCSRNDAARTAAVVLDDFPAYSVAKHASLVGVKMLQLWHGVPLKKIGFPEIASGVNMNPQKAWHLARQYSGYAAAPSTSPWMTSELFSHVFKADDFPTLGFPRNDIMLRPPSRHDMLTVDTEVYGQLTRHKKSGGKIIIYMPTFRDNGDYFAGVKELDLRMLDVFCARHNIIFVAKFHPFVPSDISGALPNVILYGRNNDIYPLLGMADALITDYSSIYFDFLLVDKPLIFYPYDKEEYLSRDREMFFDYDDITPGIHAYNQEELLAAILKTLVTNEDPEAEARRALCDKVFTHKDAQSAHRVCRYIRDHLL